VIAAPFIDDARGRRIRDLEWELDGDRLSVRIDDRRLPLPYVIDPASSYPQRIHPEPNYMTGSSSIQGLIAPPLGGANINSGMPAESVGEWFVWSGNSTGHTLGVPITNASAPDPQNMDNQSICSGNWSCNGALGWSQELLGGATLPAGPYTVQTEFYYTATNNNNLPAVSRPVSGRCG
jgi:hypothetical protein